jgi:hypothetical protein
LCFAGEALESQMNAL